MAELLCGGPWDSEVAGDDDGLFALEVNETTGEITGTHENEEGTFDVWGTCEHSFFKGHHIDLWEPRPATEREPAFAYRYYAKIKPHDEEHHKTENGKRRRVSPQQPRETRDEDEWVGTHTT